MISDSTRSTLARKLRETVGEILQRVNAPGAAVALSVDGEALFEGSVGFRDLDRSGELPPQAKFYIYSITKVMIAAASLQLVEQGHLELDAPLQTYLSSFPIAQPLTLRQVLNHSAGLPDYGAMPAYNEAIRANPRRPWSSQEFLANTLQGGLLYAPGEGWAYSNIGYLALRMALEQYYGDSLQTILSRQIFEPLELRSMYVANSLEGVEALSPGHTAFWREDGTLEDMRARYHPGWVAHGVVVSTARDLSRFMQALFDGKLIGASLIEDMCQPQTVPAEHPYIQQPGYGLGLMLDRQSPYGLTAGHGGGGPGYSAAAFYFANVEGYTISSVALVNRDYPDVAVDIAFTLKDLVGTQN